MILRRFAAVVRHISDTATCRLRIGRLPLEQQAEVGLEAAVVSFSAQALQQGCVQATQV
eukprot:CAMPEP_0198219888 /NCGR_PEP_ID=MMETSP1445-20131203/76632_1 /TAXON_ID=36898 /ORGANISM="Pyramimonas sp., Strain CCMP2087" /LENGTH=58 /DNA_ID=CAMNT_0043897459 /DNA_START=89 /DNA_END=262 /DNA_ORIENTATION=+